MRAHSVTPGTGLGRAGVHDNPRKTRQSAYVVAETRPVKAIPDDHGVLRSRRADESGVYAALIKEAKQIEKPARTIEERMRGLPWPNRLKMTAASI